MKQINKAILIFTIVISIFLAMSLSAVVVFAQDAPETGDTVSETVLSVNEGYVPPEDIAIGLEGFLNEHMSIPALASLVLILTAFTKRYAPKQFESKQIQFFWVIVTYVIYAVASNQGYTVELGNASELITKIGNLLLGATGTAVASHHGYQLTKNAGVPIIGTSRKIETD